MPDGPTLAWLQKRSSLTLVRDLLVIATLAIFGLFVSAGFLVPLTVAVLAFVLITAVSDRILQHLPAGAPSWFASLIAVIVVLSGLFFVMFVIGNQATGVARTFPSYEARIDAAVARITSLIGNQAADAIRAYVVGIDLSLIARNAFGGARSFLTTFFLIALYVGFLMAERRSFSAKVKLAASDPETRHRIERISGKISNSLQRYISVKTFFSALTALISYSVFRVLGLEFAETWAVLTFALNFIPSIGSIIAVIFPALIALIQFDTVAPFLIVVLGCGSIQFVIGNFLEPLFLGRSLNLSTFMVILSLTFWTTIWGITGAFLSVPLTVGVLIVFSHIPATRPIAIMMSQSGEIDEGEAD